MTAPTLRPPDPAAADDLLPRRELNRRVSSGVLAVGAFGGFNLVVGFGGNIVLARMLAPRDFGLVAIGATLMIFATTLSEGGLGSGLIRRAESPTRDELRAVLALQLTLTGALALGTVGIASFFGSAGAVVAVMICGLPLTAVQTPGKVVLSRALRFRVLTGVDAVGVLAYYGWAIAWVIAGAGVWALATGVVFRALVSTCAMALASRGTNLVPSYRNARSLWPVITFGIRFQGISVAGMLREQGLNAAVAGLSGVGTLGLWTLAKRILEVPVLITEPLHRVAFPYMSQLRAAREDPGPVIERGIRVTGTVAGVVLTGLAAGASGLVPGVFGEQWRETAVAVQWVCGSLLVAAPLAVVAVGFLYAVGEPSVVLRATVVHTVTLFVVAFPLLPFVGVNAIGAGSLAGAVVDAVILGRAVARRSSARPFGFMAVPLVLGAPAAVAGALLTHELGNNLPAALAGGLLAALLYLGAVFLVRRETLLETASLVARSLRTGLGRDRAAPILAASPAK
jgi:O-antigen/teichoic acid export membrane protein